MSNWADADRSRLRYEAIRDVMQIQKRLFEISGGRWPSPVEVAAQVGLSRPDPEPESKESCHA